MPSDIAILSTNERRQVSMTDLRKQIDETVGFIRTKTKSMPRIGIILGTGLGGLALEIEKELEIEYEEIPHFPVSTVESHHGRLIFGILSGKPVVAMQGRFHYYEGYSMKQITFPVRAMKFLGVETLLISNAAGALNPLFKKGDVMLMVDHINLLGDNPLIGPNDDSLGPRFPDMSEAYDRGLLELAEQAALDLKIRVQKGVYVAMTGPNLETRSEYRFLRYIGADAVGMSTVPENIVAVHMGMKVFGVSIMTDECFPDSLKPVTLEEVIAVANKAEPRMTAVMKEVVRRMKV
jgi:purine-nucleoside phosphorylase